MTNLYALIVGIEKYDLPNWNRSGPVAGAIEMAYWCNRIGMPYKNIHMFLSINDQDPTWLSEQQSTISHFRKTGATIVEDTSLNAIDTFWRNTLPTLPNVDSKLLVYWCGHGVTGTDRDRILLHTDYRPDNLSSRVTSADNLVASLATQTYRRFSEQLILADVCGDFSSYSVSPNTHPPVKPVDSITQHCYFATVDGQSTQIQRGIGQFTQSTLDVLKQYQSWPDLDELKERMDEKFPKGSNRPFKTSIWTPGGKYDEKNAYASTPSIPGSIPSSSATIPIVESLERLIRECEQAFINDLWDDLFDKIDGFILMLSSVGTRYRNELVVFRRDFQDNRASWRIKSINDEDYKVAKTSLWIRVREMLYSVREDLKVSQSKKNANEISIPSPDKDTSTVTPASRVSSSPPSVPPKSHHDFFREQIYKLLDGNDELTAVFAQAIFSKNQKWDKNSVAEHLVGNSGSTNDFPLRRFKRVLAKLVDERIELKKDSFQTLTLLTEILEIASYPLEDSQRIEKAMQEILSSDIINPAIGSLSTSKIEDAKKLLIATRLKLLGAEFSDLSVAQLFNKNMMDNTDVRLLMRKIHVVTEPTLKSEDLTLIEFYSKACIDDLNYTQSSSSYQDDLQDVLEEKSKDSAVVCLLLSNEKTEAIKQLRKRFPLLLVIGLPKESIGLYKLIVRDLKDIDECLPLLCGTVKRIT
jgi:hypothetical protein